jgi:redox-sensitive bicupin YhaK (pirin superfamily)
MQRAFDPSGRAGRLQALVGPDERDGKLMINQDAWISRADIVSGQSLQYRMHRDGNGVYLFVISGELMINGEALHHRDAAGISSIAEFAISASDDSELLFIEVPVN